MFFDDFFPTNELPQLGTVEGLAYAPFVSQFSRISLGVFTVLFKVISTQPYLPGFRIVESFNWQDSNPDIGFLVSSKPDVSVYRVDMDLNVRTDSSKVEMFIEFKWKISDDLFNVHNGGMDDKKFIHTTSSAITSLGQISSYTAAQLNSQFERMPTLSSL